MGAREIGTKTPPYTLKIKQKIIQYHWVIILLYTVRTKIKNMLIKLPLEKGQDRKKNKI